MPVPVRRPRQQSRRGLWAGVAGDASGALSLWLPVIVWAAVIFTFSSISGLGTGLGAADTVLRKGAHIAEYAIFGLLLLRAIGRELLGATAFHRRGVRILAKNERRRERRLSEAEEHA